ncbi:hypothetical protein J4440_02220 [Candidatus Woesearchaeota archaeon]|nr:hypothetical protein [Candidatus Woesearchaeota archaeon]
MEQIILEQDIINTYPEKNIKLSEDYIKYLKLKNENPNLGYKKLSKLMNEPIHRTRYWHHGNAIPQPVRTVNWLKEKGLLPLNSDNPNINLITKIFGATFGDGGIFGNLNAIFISSSELEAVKEFGEDLKKLFGEEIEENFRIIEGGEYGHSWCYQNTNRNIIRFFMALGAPIGDKSFTSMLIPNWIKTEKIEDEFYGSLFGAEIGIPKVHINKKNLDSLSFGITGTEKFAENRIRFLSQMANYLNNKGIKTGTININEHKKVNRGGEPTKIYRLLISIEFDNVTNFMTLTKMNYCRYKKEKLANTMNEFSEIKRQRIKEMLELGYGLKSILNLLNLSETSLEIIENYENFHAIYNDSVNQYLVPEIFS